MTQGLLVKARDGNKIPLTGFTRSHTPFKSSAVKQFLLQAHLNERLRMTEAPYGFEHLLELAVTLNLGVPKYVPHSTSECGGHCLRLLFRKIPLKLPVPYGF